jgi:acetyltransferase
MTTMTTMQGSRQVKRGINPVTVRPIRLGDADAIYAMHKRLLPESLYYRYLQYRIPPLAEVAALCNMSPEQGAGFVAVTHTGCEHIVGVAHYVRDGGQHTCAAELAILVEDRYQGLGIGRSLWQRLHQHAAADRLCELRVIFDVRNHRLLRLIQGSGYLYKPSFDGDLNDYRVVLSEPPQPSRIRRFLGRFVTYPSAS